MIEINLLPEELRKKESFFKKIDLSAFSVQKIPVFPVAIGVAGFLIAIQLVVSGLAVYTNFRAMALAKKYEALLPDKKQADALKAKDAVINMQSSAIDELMSRRFSWAKKLSALSDAMTPGIWLTELNYDERPVSGARASAPPDNANGSLMGGTLALIGYASGAGEQGATLVGRLIKSLKESEPFFKDFARIDLVSVRSDKVDNNEVMKFRINCFFR